MTLTFRKGVLVVWMCGQPTPIAVVSVSVASNLLVRQTEEECLVYTTLVRLRNARIVKVCPAGRRKTPGALTRTYMSIKKRWKHAVKKKKKKGTRCFFLI